MAAGFVGLRCRLNPQIPFIQKLTYAQQNQLLFRSALTRLVREAGDADTYVYNLHLYVFVHFLSVLFIEMEQY